MHVAQVHAHPHTHSHTLTIARHARAHTDLAIGSLGLSGEGWLDAHSLLQALKRKAASMGATFMRAKGTRVVCNHQQNRVTGNSAFGCDNSCAIL